MTRYIKALCIMILIIYIISFQPLAFAENTASSDIPFTDVPKTSYAFSAINELRQLGITNGIGNNLFGYGQTVTRGEFVTFLVRLMGWEQITPVSGSFSDNRDTLKFFYSSVETALAKGVISKEPGNFRPLDAITREEAAIMLVNCLGYGTLAGQLDYFSKPFPDVENHIGYITIARDLGIFNGTSIGFEPDGSALREQVAAILVRMSNALKRPVKDLNAFYAISSSSQQDKIADLSSICFGWSSLSYDEKSGNIVVNNSRSDLGYNDYYLPAGFTQRLASAKQAGIPALLMLYSTQNFKMKNPDTDLTTGIPEYVLAHPEVYRKLINDIILSINNTTLGSETGSFDGVVIDMEGLKGADLKQSFNDFLKELKTALDKENKKLYVAVHPLIHPKRSAVCMDGYDYRTIGSLADKVILMAHDYDAKKLTQADMDRGFDITPLTPLEDVYYALQTITDKTDGVLDKTKIMLQLSFDWTVWHEKDGKILNSVHDSFSMENFIKLLESDTPLSFNYSEEYANPYIKYTDPKSGVENTVWYENTSSILEKIKLARLFGIQGISLWRLGQIPDYQPADKDVHEMDIWQSVLNEMEKR
ncbi:MAG: S-layer homology domain-containing protein [Clostridiaceae bacterium]